MQLKILQLFTVIIFAIVFLVGLGLVFWAPERIASFGSFVLIILPAWISSITAAFLGKPITEAAAGLRAKLETKTTTETTSTAGGAVTETKTETTGKAE